MKLEKERAKRTKARGEPDDPELFSRMTVVRDGIYKRLKLLASWADLDDEQVLYRSLAAVSSKAPFNVPFCSA